MNNLRILAVAAAGAVLAGVSAAGAAPLPPTTDAHAVNAGLTAMRDFNLIVLKDLQSTSGVQGRTFVGGNLSGGSSNYFTKPGTQTGTGLVVGGNITGGTKQVNTGGDLKVGGNLESGANMNGGGDVFADGDVKKVNANGAAVYSAGNVENVNAKDIYYGGAIKSSNGVKHAGDKTYDALSQEIADTTAALTSNLLETSEYLAGLDPTNAITYSADKQHAIFDAGATGSGVAVFKLTDFTSALKSQSQLIVTMPANYDVIVINVAGTDVSLPGGINFQSGANLGAKLVWNFYEATSLNFGSKAWYGSVLAPKAAVKMNNFVEGTVVAKSLVQNGEIRMTNFQARPTIYAPQGGGLGGGAVPEPATWAMMILGFGAIGAVLRRRKAALA
jgi:choice-of-anchor A domain-containing protein